MSLAMGLNYTEKQFVLLLHSHRLKELQLRRIFLHYVDGCKIGLFERAFTLSSVRFIASVLGHRYR